MTDNAEKILAAIAAQFGEITVARLTAVPAPVEVVSSGVLSVDRALVVGGFPRQRITTIYGPESGGKTTLVLWTIGKALKEGLRCVFIDVEQGGSEEYFYSCFRNAGVQDIEKHIEDNSLIVLRPETAEAALEAAKALIPITDFMVIDSISSLTPTVVLETEAGRHTIGVDARFQTTEFKKVKSILGASNCAMVVISQVRTNIGGYGAPETTTEPKAVRHIASIRLRVSKDGQHRSEKGKPIAQPVKLEVKKNKVGIPHLTAKFEIILGKGVDAEDDTLTMAADMGIVSSGGGFYRYPNTNNSADWLMDVRGKNAAAAWLREHQDVYKQIYGEVLSQDSELPLTIE